MGLKFLNKKGWHPSNFRNQEKKWKAEQKQANEEKKLEELRKQIHADQEAEEIRRLQEQAGIAPRQERLEFLYESGLGVGKASAEEYLLGKPVELEAPKSEEISKSSSAPGALFSAPPAEDKTKTANEMWRKMHADPLFLIRQQEQAAMAQIRSNPVKMEMIKKQAEQESHKEKKRKSKKERKEEKKRKRKEKKKRREKGSDSEESDGSEDSRDRGGGRGGGVGSREGERDRAKAKEEQRGGVAADGDGDTRREHTSREWRGRNERVGAGRRDSEDFEDRNRLRVRHDSDEEAPRVGDGRAQERLREVGHERGSWGHDEASHVHGRRASRREGEGIGRSALGRERRDAFADRGGRREGEMQNEGNEERYGGSSRRQGRDEKDEWESKWGKRRHDLSDEEQMKEAGGRRRIGGKRDELEGGKGRGAGNVSPDCAGGGRSPGGRRVSSPDRDEKDRPAVAMPARGYYGLTVTEKSQMALDAAEAERVSEARRKAEEEREVERERKAQEEEEKQRNWREKRRAKAQGKGGGMSEEERQTRLREMEQEAEVQEEKRWERIRHVKGKEAKEEERNEALKAAGESFVEDANKAVYGASVAGGSVSIEESIRRRSHFREKSSSNASNAFRR